MQSDKLSDRKKTGKNIPRWEQKEAATVVGAFSVLGPEARMRVLGDLAAMCGCTVSQVQNGAAGKATDAPKADNKSAKGPKDRGGGNAPPAHDVNDDPAAGQTAPVVRRVDATPPIRVRDDTRQSPLVGLYEATKRSERGKEPAHGWMVAINILQSALRRYDKLAEGKPPEATLDDLRDKLIAGTAADWAEEQFSTAARLSFGGKLKDVAPAALTN